MELVVREFDPERDRSGAEAIDRMCPVCRVRHSPAFRMLAYGIGFKLVAKLGPGSGTTVPSTRTWPLTKTTTPPLTSSLAAVATPSSERRPSRATRLRPSPLRPPPRVHNRPLSVRSRDPLP
ncbi:uncharacterized protein A4U43_C08F12460 [Asparagus officinalis]|nr:uncharacterized protein A4U43_C08F12460 [Asparagus officinalis]